MQLLNIEGLSKSFGGLKAVSDVTFEVAEGQVTGLIGPNGSGKTTMLNLLTGFLRPDTGTVTFDGETITGMPRSRICSKGIARTFQLVKPFLEFTALQNVMVGQVFGHGPAKNLRLAQEESKESLEKVGLIDKANVLAKDLTLMQRKRLELARCLAAKPKLLLLDELMAGLNPKEADDACVLIEQIRSSKITILMVEHIVRVICGLSHRVVVLNMGAKIVEGPPDEIIHDPQVIDVYLGGRMLKLEAVDAYYDDLQALWGISFEINEGELVALVGPNGAGKTTTLRVISGLLNPKAGHVMFMNRQLGKEPAHRIVELGISQVLEGGKVFTGMSVLENLELGAFIAQARKAKDETLRSVYKIFPRLEERKHQRVGTLSGGERQMLAIGRALMAKPKLLMLDEPSFGLAPILVEQMFQMIKEINREGVTILLVEQNVRAAMELTNRAYVIENGRIAGHGSGDDLLSFESVRSAYLGEC